MQPPPRFLKLREDEPEKVESRIIESKNQTLSNHKTACSSLEMTDDATTTKDDISERDIGRDEKDNDRSDSVLNTPNLNEAAENKGLLSEIEPKTIEQPTRPSVIHHEEQHRDENAYNSDDSHHSQERRGVDEAKLKNVQSGKTYISSWGKRDEYNEKKSRLPPKHDNEKITEGKRIGRVRSPQWFSYYDDDDDNDDDEFSTRLGSITRKDQRTTMLPKQMNGNRRDANIIIV
jgi:hypothetical protein